MSKLVLMRLEVMAKMQLKVVTEFNSMQFKAKAKFILNVA